MLFAACLVEFDERKQSIDETYSTQTTDTKEFVGKMQKVIDEETGDRSEAASPLWEAGRTIHVFVALCDNENQGIVPVPAAIGNGQKPSTNLYWGAGYGVKTFFDKKSKDWNLLKTIPNPAKGILERILFKHSREDVYLLADAWDGARIKETTIAFFQACSGAEVEGVEWKGKQLGFGGDADLLGYIGHDGLMEFDLSQSFQPRNTEKREAIMLACISKSYFSPYLKQTGATPVLWTTGLMAPEAYTLEWALDAWVDRKSTAQLRQRAAEAYHHYQKCGINGAKRLLVSGW